tara:strand:+ start:2440 stop:3027 length:588 start_codon:yes stop_codon:yes gene_type:complete
MSQLNVDALRHSSGTGPGIDLQSSGNIAFDTNTLYVDTTNDRVGINDATPSYSLDVTGTEGVNLNTSPVVEGINIVAGASNSTTNIDLLTNSTTLFTSANTGNWTPNFRGNSSTTLNSVMSTGQVIVATIISANGGSSGYSSNITIDGSGVSEEWLNNDVPATRGGTSGFDFYQYTIIKTGNAAFTVFAARSYCD